MNAGASSFAIAAVLVHVAACSQDATSSIRQTSTPLSDPCDALRERTFRSTTDQVVGLGQNGLALGRTTIQFKGDLVTLQLADAFETVPFSCANGKLTARIGESEWRAFYEQATRTLTVGDVTYVPVE